MSSGWNVLSRHRSQSGFYRDVLGSLAFSAIRCEAGVHDAPGSLAISNPQRATASLHGTHTREPQSSGCRQGEPGQTPHQQLSPRGPVLMQEDSFCMGVRLRCGASEGRTAREKGTQGGEGTLQGGAASSAGTPGPCAEARAPQGKRKPTQRVQEETRTARFAQDAACMQPV